MLSAAVSALFILYIEEDWGREELFKLLDTNRQALYASVAAIAGSLLGFIVATAAIILVVADSPRLRIVRESRHYGTLYSVLFTSIKYLAVTTVAALVTLMIDKDNDPKVEASYVLLFCAILSTLAVARTVWVLENVITIAVASEQPTRSR